MKLQKNSSKVKGIGRTLDLDKCWRFIPRHWIPLHQAFSPWEHQKKFVDARIFPMLKYSPPRCKSHNLQQKDRDGYQWLLQKARKVSKSIKWRMSPGTVCFATCDLTRIRARFRFTYQYKHALGNDGDRSYLCILSCLTNWVTKINVPNWAKHNLSQAPYSAEFENW